MEWQPIDLAPRDGTSFLVPPQYGFTHCFFEDGWWWWHNQNELDGYAVGPEPSGWMPAPPTKG
jgi:hypothetical protein